ncbi:3'-5' exonuclease [Clostridium carnis]
MSLNKEQNIVINELDKNIILLASAGTGKTETLAKRITNIISREKAKPSEILCITFTNKACREMEERISKRLGGKAKDITIKTFHSFCFDIIKSEAKKRTDIFTDFMIFDEEDCKELIKTCNYMNFSIGQLQRFIDFIKIERAKLDIYSNNIIEDYNNVIAYVFKNKEEVINNICTEKGQFNGNLKNFFIVKGGILVNTYNSLLHNNHGLDFADIIVKVKELFKSKDVIFKLSEKYKYINIDEVQDTSTLEYSIIERIFKDNNILICGDIFQTIYGWRGSEPLNIFKEYKNKYNPIEIVFSKNYRATKILTNASLDFLRNAFSDEVNEIYKSDIKSESVEVGEKISLKVTEDLLEEAHFIIDEIRKLEEAGCDLSKICILTRDNNYNIALSDKIGKIIEREGANFSFILVDQFKFFRRQEVKDIISFLKLICNRYDSISLKRIVKRLPTGVGDKAFEAIDSKKYKSIGIELCDFIDIGVREYGEKYGMLLREFSEDNIIIFDVESTGIDVTSDEIIQIAAIKINRSGDVIEVFEKFLKNKKSVNNSKHVHGFSDEFLRENGEEKEKVLREFIEFSKDAVIVGHNVQFDINILTSEASRVKISKPKFKGFYDTLDIYRRFYPNLKNHKLETLSNIFNTTHKPSHNAMDDILATKELLVMAIKNDITKTSLERMTLMNNHLKAFSKITNKLDKLFKESLELRPFEIVAYIINEFHIKSLYTGEEGKEKIERLRDFYYLLREIDDKEKSNRDSLLEIIKITSLSNGELENLMINRAKAVRIPIITVHQAKGLEFETVFLSGLKQNTFPSYMSVKSNNLEEEKRTFYVAITRAKKRLYLTANRDGGYFRKTTQSTFINLIPKKYIENR